MKIVRLFGPAVVFFVSLFLAPIGQAHASLILNDDFSQTTGNAANPFVGWQTTYGDPPTDGGGFAVFTERRSHSLRRTQQTFNLPSGAGITGLGFDYKIASSGIASPLTCSRQLPGDTL